MNSFKSDLYKKVIFIMIGLILNALIFIYIPPKQIFGYIGKETTMTILIIFEGILFYILSSIFLQKKDQFLISVGFISFLVISYKFGLQILNTILLILFIIIIHFLLYQSSHE
jgi:hypothetical protein